MTNAKSHILTHSVVLRQMDPPETRLEEQGLVKHDPTKQTNLKWIIRKENNLRKTVKKN